MFLHVLTMNLLPRKRTRTEHSDDEDSGSNDQASGGPGHSPEAFLIKAGHRFCIICGPWLHTGALIFQNDLDDTYNTAERFENEESKSQAQLREVWDPLQAKLKLKRVWAVKDGTSPPPRKPKRSHLYTAYRTDCRNLYRGLFMKKTIVNIIKEGDQHVFPDTNTSLVNMSSSSIDMEWLYPFPEKRRIPHSLSVPITPSLPSPTPTVPPTGDDGMGAAAKHGRLAQGLPSRCRNPAGRQTRFSTRRALFSEPISPAP
ncbi:hypothetical protein BJ912DRAFT_935455 [Pholiota molesta]|nr:hypothetical protein BJ912DRAFT_935455 [Pholiota molesta]